MSKMNAEIGRIITSPDVKAKLLTIGMESKSSPPEQFDAFLRNEVGKGAKVIKATGLKLE